MKLRKLDDVRVFGRRIWWTDPDDNTGVFEVKESSDNSKFFFALKGVSYELLLVDLVKEVEKQVKIKEKKDKKE